MERHWGFFTAHRIPVEVRAGQAPVVDARVQLLDSAQRVVWQTRTDRRGNASLFPDLFEKAGGPFSIVVSTPTGTTTVAQVDASTEAPIQVQATAAPPRNGLDVMFVIDTTGSMGDELSYLQAEVGSVIERVQQKHGQQLEVRTSVNFYRDHGDAYLVRPFPFTTRVADAARQLADQAPGGGGDFPEAVDEALDDALNHHTWSESARARLLFLVLDAPPHHEPQVLDRLHTLTLKAAEQGIRVIPVVASGIDKPTEFLMRQMAVTTGGTYLFLTDHSGIGGAHLKPTTGPTEILHLNDLLVRVINDQLDAR